jgi:hypothetical protein
MIDQKYLQTDQTGTKYMNKIYDYKLIVLRANTLKGSLIIYAEDRRDNDDQPRKIEQGFHNYI